MPCLPRCARSVWESKAKGQRGEGRTEERENGAFGNRHWFLQSSEMNHRHSRSIHSSQLDRASRSPTAAAIPCRVATDRIPPACLSSLSRVEWRAKRVGQEWSKNPERTARRPLLSKSLVQPTQSVNDVSSFSFHCTGCFFPPALN